VLQVSCRGLAFPSHTTNAFNDSVSTSSKREMVDLFLTTIAPMHWASARCNQHLGGQALTTSLRVKLKVGFIPLDLEDTAVTIACRSRHNGECKQDTGGHIAIMVFSGAGRPT